MDLTAFKKMFLGTSKTLPLDSGQFIAPTLFDALTGIFWEAAAAFKGRWV